MHPHDDDPDAPCAILEAAFGNVDEGDRRSVLLVEDRLVAEIDAFGPMTRAAAHLQAVRIRTDLEAMGLDGVVITIVPLREPLDPPPEHDQTRG
jgi:hypothetical protein